MTDRIITALTVASAVGAGLLAGLLFAFSTSVMPALRAQPAASAIKTMQAANSAILNPLFLLVFGGSALVCIALTIVAPFGSSPATPVRIGGALLFFLGCIVVTATVNVPMNNALAILDPASGEAAASWAHYLQRWTLWNNLRTAAAAIACIALTIAATQ